MSDSFLSQTEEEAIVAAIQSAEKATSGEIRVHLEAHCAGGDAMKRAQALFHELGMDATAEQNGVLIYLAYEDHLFSIIGDRGINNTVPADFWESTAAIMSRHFKNGAFAEGLIHGIEHAGQQLSAHFPYTKDDKNELDDSISKG